MMRKTRTLTAVGLPLRDELLVKSLLQVITTKTLDEWTFQEGMDADLALCNPNSALSGSALRRAANSDHQTCASLIHDGDESLPGTATLHAPIKSGEFIALLNLVSNLIRPGRVDERPSTSRSVAPSRQSDMLIVAIHDLIGHTRQGIYGAATRTETLFVDAVERKFFSREAKDAASRERALLSREFRIERRDDNAAIPTIEKTEKWEDLDALMWSSALHGLRDQLIPELSPSAEFALRRWPDFGRLQHEPFHYRLAALLTRGRYSVAALSEASNRSTQDVQAFLNACALCELLEELAPRAPSLEIVAQRVASQPRQSRYAMIFRSIRSALGMAV